MLKNSRINLKLPTANRRGIVFSHALILPVEKKVIKKKKLSSNEK